MKKIYLLLPFLALSILSYGQNKMHSKVTEIHEKKPVEKFDLFSLASTPKQARLVQSPVDTMLKLNFHASVGRMILNEKPQAFSFDLPVSANKVITIDLIENKIHSDDFYVTNANNERVEVEKAIYYKGVIKGDPQSLVAISFNNEGLNGFVANQSGTFEIGPLKDQSEYVYYNLEGIEKPWECFVEEVPNSASQIFPKDLNVEAPASPNFVACRAVRIYIEADYDTYKYNGYSTSNTVNYVNTIFNQVKVLYENENIEVEISQIKVWDSTDPYAGYNNTQGYLYAFRDYLNGDFNGDLAHAITVKSIGGGKAYLDVLGSNSSIVKVGVSGGLGSYTATVPNYSWNVDVITHELGHNLGSPHTHSCTWPGGAIDNCYPTEEGCPQGPAPVNGGTIMSYCHLIQYGNPGVNFANGFGSLPGNLIRNRVVSHLGGAQTPVNLSANNIHKNSAILFWDALATTPFTLSYKKTSEPSWTNIPDMAKNHELTGLTANTNYQWRVKSECSSYSNTSTFKTKDTGNYSGFCDPQFSLGCSTSAYIGIENVTIDGVVLDQEYGCVPNKTTFIHNGPRIRLKEGESYPFKINLLLEFNQVHAAIWIDFNNNGTFDTNEKVFTTTSSTNSAIEGNINIPAGLFNMDGVRVRVVLTNRNPPANPCGSYGYGESEDFLIDIEGVSNPCPDIITLASPVDDLTSGIGVIQAKKNSGRINATNKITSSAKLTLEAGSIELQPGFKADKGTLLKVQTGGCE